MHSVVLNAVALIGLAVVLSSSSVRADSGAAAIYKGKCVMCHAADGSGDSPTGKALKVKNLRSEEVQKQSDTELTEVITKGRNKMPAFGQKLKPEEIQELVTYIRQLGKK
jgi:mono/diheme cytochrome c family protein